jgi:hypothetical protein
MRALLVAALLVWAGQAAGAEDDNSANYLLPACRASVDTNYKHDLFIQGACAGMITGIRDMLHHSKVICSPDKATNGQAIRVVIQYIEARPERMHERFSLLAREALIAAWPCRK